jgi:hypothetical protein
MAMGTPATPLYSILTFGVHENTHIFNTFSKNILYYKRFIDDIFCIWLDDSSESWNNFKAKLNNFGSLKWNIENLTHTTTFLYLQLWIKDNRI